MKLFTPKVRALISIPAKNEESTIASVIEKSRAEMKRLSCDEVVVLVVNDGSTDQTAERAQEAGAVVLSHMHSVGLGTVFQQAVAYATENTFDYMLTIDGDGQFSEGDIPALMRPLIEDQADVVTGSRFLESSETKNIPPIKRWGNKVVARFVSSILEQTINDVSCGFRAYNKKALHHLNLFGGFTYTQEVLLNLGYKNMRILEVPITTTYFAHRTSRIAANLFSYGWAVLKIILSSMLFYRPMKLFGTLAVLLLIASALLAYLPATHYLFEGSITPYKALGVTAMVTLVLALAAFVVGLFMQSISRLQLSVDRLLYYQKRKQR